MSIGNLQGGGGLPELRVKVERQNLLIQTLCRILIEKGVIQEEELQEWLAYVDSLDGREDGKLSHSKAPIQCRSCKRINGASLIKCQYCGETLPVDFLTKDPS